MASAADRIETQRAPEPGAEIGFRDLPRHILREMEEISFPLRYPAGTALFTEGEEARGVFFIISGQVKVSICSGDGKTIILRMTEAGDMLGIPAALSGTPYEVTAETLGPVQFAFIKREPFLRFMHAHKQVALAVTQQLTQIYHSACHEIRCLGLTHTASEKLAQVLLRWPLGNGDRASKIRFAFRHEDVAQRIGTSRETVSRIFTELKKKGIVELNGSMLHIYDRDALELVASGTPPAAIPDERRSRSHSNADYQIDGV